MDLKNTTTFHDSFLRQVKFYDVISEVYETVMLQLYYLFVKLLLY